jgi:hypothetical protein
MEPEGSSQCSQELAAGPYPEQVVENNLPNFEALCNIS